MYRKKDTERVIVVYIPSSQMEYQSFRGNPHGNSNRSHVHQRLPSEKRQEIREKMTSSSVLPKQIYDGYLNDVDITNLDDDDEVGKLINVPSLKAIQNVKQSVDNSHEQYELMISEMIKQHKGDRKFIRGINLGPDSICIILCSDFQLELMTKLEKERVTVEYDTTFELGDFYFSYITLPNIFITNHPNFYGPAIIHTTKTGLCHSQFFLALKSLSAKIFSIGTDQEQAICSSIASEFPHALHLVCWRHFQDNIQRKLKELKVDNEKLESVVTLLLGRGDDKGILECSTKQELTTAWPKFESCLVQILGTDVGASFGTYMTRNKFEVIQNHMLQDIRERALGSSQPFYTNKAEGKNRSLKRDVTHNQTLFKMCTSFDTLTFNEEKEWYRARLGFGRYSLAKDHLNLKLSIPQLRKLVKVSLAEELEDESNCEEESNLTVQMALTDDFKQELKNETKKNSVIIEHVCQTANQILSNHSEIVEIGSSKSKSSWMAPDLNGDHSRQVIEKDYALKCLGVNCKEFKDWKLCVVMWLLSPSSMIR